MSLTLIYSFSLQRPHRHKILWFKSQETDNKVIIKISQHHEETQILQEIGNQTCDKTNDIPNNLLSQKKGKKLLTVSLRAILKAEGERQSGVVFEELCSKSIPPQIVRLLERTQEKMAHVWIIGCASIFFLIYFLIILRLNNM